MRFITKILQVATKRNFFFCLLITVLTYIVMMFILMPFLSLSAGLLPLDMRLTYTLTDVNQLFTTLGSTGRQLYSSFQLADTIFPIALALTLMLLLAIILQRVSDPPQRLALVVFIPLGGALADYAENILIATQLINYPTLSAVTVTIASTFTVIKWSFIIAILVLVIALGTYSLSKTRKSHSAR